MLFKSAMVLAVYRNGRDLLGRHHIDDDEDRVLLRFHKPTMPYLKAFTTFTREGDRDRVRRKHTGASHCLNLNSIIVLPVSSSMPLLTFKSGAIIIIATNSLDYVTRKMSGRRRRQRPAGRRSGSQVELDFMARGHLWSFGPQDPIRTVLSLV